MPEGHIVHRIAASFNHYFASQIVTITSPQGRFAQEARLVSGQVLQRAFAVGKQMFLEFENDLTVRVHLGIFGKWQVHQTTDEPDVQGQVRARFSSANTVVDLRGPTICEVIDEAAVGKILARLGPDPLNPNPRGREFRRFEERVLCSSSPIALLLMNQDVVSGIGNVYRAELLFRAKIEPHTAGNSLTKAQVAALWRDSVKLMRVGEQTGFMITRERLFAKHPSKEDRNYVYKREGQPCRKCGTHVSIELMASRKLYWCPMCQK
jgi:endonuclease-8